MSDTTINHCLHGDWILIHDKVGTMDRSQIIDSDGNEIYSTYRLMIPEEADAYCRGFEYGIARGKAIGESDTKNAIRRALGL